LLLIQPAIDTRLSGLPEATVVCGMLGPVAAAAGPARKVE
jgi:hypothetical protein